MMATPTQIHSEFIWRFYSCQKRRYHTVIAASESEARSQLPDAPCIFSARFSATNRPQINYWYMSGVQREV
jgi:hypothetical protein